MINASTGESTPHAIIAGLSSPIRKSPGKFVITKIGRIKVPIRCIHFPYIICGILLKSHSAAVISPSPCVAVVQNASRFGSKNRLYVSRHPQSKKKINPAIAPAVTYPAIQAFFLIAIFFL